MSHSATATVKGGFWEQYGSTVTQTTAMGPSRKLISQQLGERSNLALRETIRALNGVAPGATASKTLTRIEANSELGGKRVVESIALINRATTTTDRDDITNDLLSNTSKTTFGASPPANKDGNPLGTR